MIKLVRVTSLAALLEAFPLPVLPVSERYLLTYRKSVWEAPTWHTPSSFQESSKVDQRAYADPCAGVGVTRDFRDY